jgi:hypothetical protein
MLGATHIHDLLRILEAGVGVQQCERVHVTGASQVDGLLAEHLSQVCISNPRIAQASGANQDGQTG